MSSYCGYPELQVLHIVQCPTRQAIYHRHFERQLFSINAFDPFNFVAAVREHLHHAFLRKKTQVRAIEHTYVCITQIRFQNDLFHHVEVA